MKPVDSNPEDSENIVAATAGKGATGVLRDPVDSLTVNITSRCNLSCSYCYRNQGQQRGLSWPEIRAGLDWARSRQGTGFEVFFSGGEPLLEFGLLRRAVDHLAGGNGRDSVPVTVFTNGLLLDREKVEFLVSRNIRVRLSLDGIQPAQSGRGAETWSRLDRVLRDLDKHHPVWFRSNLSTSMTVTPGNVRWLADSVRYQLDRGIETIKAGPVMTPDPDESVDVHELMKEQYEGVFEANLAHFRATGKIPFILLRRYDGPTAPEPRGPRLCSAATGANPVLDTDGILYSCMMFSPSGIDPADGDLHAMADELRLGRADDPRSEGRRLDLGTRISDVSLFDYDRQLSSQVRACGECEARQGCTICPYMVLASGKGREGFRVPAFTCSWNRLTWRYKNLFPAMPRPAEPPSFENLRERREYWAARHQKKSPETTAPGDPQSS